MKEKRSTAPSDPFPSITLQRSNQKEGSHYPNVKGEKMDEGEGGLNAEGGLKGREGNRVIMNQTVAL